MLPRLRPKARKRTGRIRCRAHLAWVRRHECCVPGCKSEFVEAAHVRRGTTAGMGQKPDDSLTIALCHTHHEEQHTIGEAEFAKRHNLDLHALVAANLFDLEHGKRVDARFAARDSAEDEEVA
jgi:hypothetical protein